MPVTIKPYDCVGCATTNPANFYVQHKSWCKRCYSYRVKGESLTKYKCRECGTTDRTKFYEYLKCVCKECKYPAVVKKIKIISPSISNCNET